ncbi:hypothetical protein SXYLSMQ121_1812 [Staphylococcus xylosus]|nr:hypothetical protein SXYLSMQ121_1812 [Staphylococcus xylosus]
MISIILFILVIVVLKAFVGFGTNCFMYKKLNIEFRILSGLAF